MNVFKTDAYLADAQLQHEWYAANAGWEVAERYFDALQRMDALLAAQPLVGPNAGFRHPRLQGYRFFLLSRPFHMHLVFHTVSAEGVILRRTMHGRRNLARRLLQPPGANGE